MLADANPSVVMTRRCCLRQRLMNMQVLEAWRGHFPAGDSRLEELAGGGSEKPGPNYAREVTRSTAVEIKFLRWSAISLEACR